MSGPEVITLGCRLNLAESAAMRALASGEEDLIIVNSCAVTNEAVRRTRQAIRRAKRARPDARIVVTGCAAQVEPETFAAMPEVARVVGNAEKLEHASFRRSLEADGGTDSAPCPGQVPAFAGTTDKAEAVIPAQAGISASPAAAPFHDGIPALAAMTDKVQVSDIFAVRDTAPHLAAGFSERSRAFVEVQNGCDHRCTFCIIPYGRGPSRSVPAGLVVDRIKGLVDEGFREVVLTGVDVTSYGPDLPGAPTLGLLVERILRHVPDLPRLRLSSLDCMELDDRLEDIVAGEPRFMPHLHMSFQAGDDMVLKRMKRRHSRAQAVETVRRLKARRPELAVGADLIAGFPTETDEMHENSVRLVDECDIVMGHVFPFSPKRGTPAARMPQVPAAAVKERARRLRDACNRQTARWLEAMVGTTQRVLVEKGGNGHAENFAPVRVRHAGEGRDLVENPQRDPGLRRGDGELVDMLITRVERGMLAGIPQ